MATRPSLLNRAELCSMVPVLSERFPEEVPAGRFGTDVHTEIARCIATGDEPVIPEAKAAVDWLRGMLDGADVELAVEVPVALMDPETMGVITQGTPDVVLTRGNRITVIDWKTGDPANVSSVDDNLQLIAYGLASCVGYAFQCCLVFLDGLEAKSLWGSIWTPDTHAALLARIKAVSARPPAFSVGDHCAACYQRYHCDAYRDRMSTALVAVGAGVPTELTTETGAKLADMVAMVDGDNGWLAQAKAALKEYVRSGGVVERNGKRMALVTQQGRESADVKALKADGLDKYVKRGAPFETTKWVKT